MIRRSTDAEYGTTKVIATATEVFVHFSTDGDVLEISAPVLRREHEVNVDLSDGLRHGIILHKLFLCRTVIGTQGYTAPIRGILYAEGVISHSPGSRSAH